MLSELAVMNREDDTARNPAPFVATAAHFASARSTSRSPCNDLFGQFHLAGEVGIMGRKPIGVFRGFGQVSVSPFFDSESRQRHGSTEPLPLRCDEL